MNTGPWAQIDQLARMAPSPHNTQPFRIRPVDERTAVIVALPDRMLPVEDADDLYVLASFGIFAETLERAGRHFGWQVRVVHSPTVRRGHGQQGSGPLLLGHASIEGRCQPGDEGSVLLARRTSRLPYEDRLVPGPVLQEFAQIAAQYGHCFESFDDPSLVQEVLECNVRALLHNNLKLAQLRELRGWIRFGPTPAVGDGLWREPMNQPHWEMRLALAAPRLFLLPGIAPLAQTRYLRTQRGTRHVAILRGPFASWPELVAAGRMLMCLWLTMTRHGVYMLPFGSMITNEACNRHLRRRFAADDIWFIFRFGYSPVPPRAPRLASVLLDAGSG
jgi:hypothetical protein